MLRDQRRVLRLDRRVLRLELERTQRQRKVDFLNLRPMQGVLVLDDGPPALSQELEHVLVEAGVGAEIVPTAAFRSRYAGGDWPHPNNVRDPRLPPHLCDGTIDHYREDPDSLFGINFVLINAGRDWLTAFANNRSAPDDDAAEATRSAVEREIPVLVIPSWDSGAGPDDYPALRRELPGFRWFSLASQSVAEPPDGDGWVWRDDADNTHDVVSVAWAIGTVALLLQDAYDRRK